MSIEGYSLTTEGGNRFSVSFQDVGGDPLARNNGWGLDQEQSLTTAARCNGERVIQIHRLGQANHRVRVEACCRG